MVTVWYAVQILLVNDRNKVEENEGRVASDTDVVPYVRLMLLQQLPVVVKTRVLAD